MRMVTVSLDFSSATSTLAGMAEPMGKRTATLLLDLKVLVWTGLFVSSIYGIYGGVARWGASPRSIPNWYCVLEMIGVPGMIVLEMIGVPGIRLFLCPQNDPFTAWTSQGRCKLLASQHATQSASRRSAVLHSNLIR